MTTTTLSFFQGFRQEAHFEGLQAALSKTIATLWGAIVVRYAEIVGVARFFGIPKKFLHFGEPCLVWVLVDAGYDTDSWNEETGEWDAPQPRSVLIEDALEIALSVAKDNTREARVVISNYRNGEEPLLTVKRELFWLRVTRG
jgi:hypothetical protein